MSTVKSIVDHCSPNCDLPCSLYHIEYVDRARNQIVVTTTGFRWKRWVIGVFAAEAIPIVTLVVLVALLGPGEPASDQEFAQTLGSWVGPIGGAVATFALSLWVLKPLSEKHLRYGALFGLAVAVLDAGLIVAGGSAFQWLFVVSQLGRVVAGFIGGFATRS